MNLPRGKRDRLPSRRKSITQKVTITGHDGLGTFYATFGEYPDGTLGEVFVECYKEGTFSKGVTAALGRVISIALQFGTPPAAIAKALRHLNFPPRGSVTGSDKVEFAHSVCDWLAQEIEQWYVDPDKRSEPSSFLIAPKPEPISANSNGDSLSDPETQLKELGGGVVWGSRQDTIVSSDTLTDTKVMGYTGDICPSCSSNRMKRNGSCLLCESCGATSGCS